MIRQCVSLSIKSIEPIIGKVHEQQELTYPKALQEYDRIPYMHLVAVIYSQDQGKGTRQGREIAQKDFQMMEKVIYSQDQGKGIRKGWEVAPNDHQNMKTDAQE